MQLNHFSAVVYPLLSTILLNGFNYFIGVTVRHAFPMLKLGNHRTSSRCTLLQCEIYWMPGPLEVGYTGKCVDRASPEAISKWLTFRRWIWKHLHTTPSSHIGRSSSLSTTGQGGVESMKRCHVARSVDWCSNNSTRLVMKCVIITVIGKRLREILLFPMTDRPALVSDQAAHVFIIKPLSNELCPPVERDNNLQYKFDPISLRNDLPRQHAGDFAPGKKCILLTSRIGSSAIRSCWPIVAQSVRKKNSLGFVPRHM